MQKGFIFIIVLLIGLSLTSAGLFYFTSNQGKACGGIAANLPENQCPAGFVCRLGGDYPDASGKCVNILTSLFAKRSETLQERVDKQNPVAPFATPSFPQPTPTTAETTNWKTYADPAKFTFRYPPTGIVANSDDTSGHIVSVKLNEEYIPDSLEVFVDASWKPGNPQADDQRWKVTVNGITWSGRYQNLGKCNLPCPAETQLDGQVDNHNVTYMFHGEKPDDNTIENYLSTFKFTN